MPPAPLSANFASAPRTTQRGAAAHAPAGPWRSTAAVLGSSQEMPRRPLAWS
jgi:hypothetical protein